MAMPAIRPALRPPLRLHLHPQRRSALSGLGTSTQAMKFSKQLLLRASPLWYDHYVDYKSLKGTLKSFRVGDSTDPKSHTDVPAAERKPTPPPNMAAIDEFTNTFSELLKVEADKVEGWYVIKETEGRARLAELVARGKSPQVNREVWLKDIEDLIANLEMLFEYSEVNIVAFKKIIKKFQKYIEHGNVSNVWTVIKAYRFFSNSELDQVLLAKAKKELRKSVPEMALTPTEALPVADQGNVPTVTKLDLDALPGGQISKLWLAVYEDGTGSLIRIPVIVAKGVKYGPTVGMTAALHGNELNGIPLIHRLFREINPQQLHGVLVAATVTNVPGYVRNQRGFSDGTDLNRIMPGKANGSSPQVYAYNLMERLIKKFDYLLDIHTASAGRVNSLYARADMINPKTKKMAILQNPQIIVHNTSPDGSLRGAAMSNDIPAITVEIGDPSKFQKRFVKNALLGVTNILCHLNMIPNEVDQPEYDPVVCSRSYWIFASKGGVLTVQPEIYTWVRKGEMIAQLHSLFGDLVETYYAPEDGVVVGKSVNPVCESGSRIIHLGVVEDSFAKEAHDGHL